MKRLRFGLALAAMAVAVATQFATAAPAPPPLEDCLFNPGETCKWHCDNPCEAGCCGDWERYAWTEVQF